MPKQKRFKTNYTGVFFIKSNRTINGKSERIYYVAYRKNGKLIEEKAGRQFQDDMTPSRANHLRSLRIEGKQESNKRRRGLSDNSNRRTIEKLWIGYKEYKGNYKSLASDECHYQRFLKSDFGDKEPHELVPLDVDRLRINLSETYAPQSVRIVMELLRRIVNFGIKKCIISNIQFKIEMPQVHNEKTEDLTSEQVARLLKAIEEDDHPFAGPMMLLALYTGMRRGELFKLQWNDIDFERGFITLKDPKGGPDQKIPLNDAARKILENHPKVLGSEYVFPGRDGGQRRDIRLPTHRIKFKAGLPKDFRPLHGLRHSFASAPASSGEVDLYTLQKLLTHKSPMMTQRYAHLRDEALKRASNLAGDIFRTHGNRGNEVVDLK